MDVFGHGADLVGGEAVEGVADELELLGQPGGAAAVAGHLLGHVLGELRRPVGGHELAGGGQLGGADAPLRLPTDEAGDEVGDGLGGEQAGQAGLETAVVAVVAHHRRPLHAGGGVGQVVGQHLVTVELGDGDAPLLAGELGQVGGGLAAHGPGDFDGLGGGVQIRGVHGLYLPPHCASESTRRLVAPAGTV